MGRAAEGSAGAHDAAPATSRTWTHAAWASLVVAAAVLAPLTVKWFAGSGPDPVVSRFELALPAGTSGRPEVSPDGQQIAAVVRDDDGIARVRIRPMGAVTFQVLAGTEDASYPFWSPDSRWVAFFAGDTLKKIAVAGGPPQALCPAPRARGGTWNRAGVVLFSADAGNVDRLQQVADNGGTPAVVTPLALPKIVIQRWPHFLPDGRHFLFFGSARQAETDGVYVGSLDEAGSTRLVAGFTEARYSDGVLFFVRDTTLMAQPFDAERRAFGAADSVVVSSVSGGGNEGAKAFSVSNTGVLVTVPLALASRNQLKWFDRSGRWIADLGVPANQRGPRISPDGQRVVMASALSTASTYGGALWTTDAKSGRSQRLTFSDGGYRFPVWSHDASVVFFGMSTQATGISDLFRQPTNGGASQESLLANRVHKQPQDVSPDGRYLVYVAAPTQSTAELLMWSLADRKSSPYVKHGFGARVSPDGRWAAYSSSTSGGAEIYVESFPTPGTRFQISTVVAPGRSGAETAASSTIRPAASSGPSRFDRRGEAGDWPGHHLVRSATGPDMAFADYDVSRDGRFLFNVPVASQTPTALVTLNWKAGLKK